MNMQSTEDLQGSENTLHDTIMMDTYMSLYMCPIHRTYNTKSEPYYKLHIWSDYDMSM